MPAELQPFARALGGLTDDVDEFARLAKREHKEQDRALVDGYFSRASRRRARRKSIVRALALAAGVSLMVGIAWWMRTEPSQTLWLGPGEVARVVQSATELRIEFQAKLPPAGRHRVRILDPSVANGVSLHEEFTEAQRCMLPQEWLDRLRADSSLELWLDSLDESGAPLGSPSRFSSSR